MNSQKPIIVWFRHDLRMTDNPALYYAASKQAPIIPVFIYDRESMDRDYGAAQKWWLHNALESLKNDFKQHNISFLIRKGDSLSILKNLIKSTDAQGVYLNRAYEKWLTVLDSQIELALKDKKIELQSFKANLLVEPWEITSGNGEFYRVFTPYYKKFLKDGPEIDAPLPKPSLRQADHSLDLGNIHDFEFLPDIRWDKKLGDRWSISEEAAWGRLKVFLEKGLAHYKLGRDCPSKDLTSRLSPYLRWGMISPRSIWHETKNFILAHNIASSGEEAFLREVFWRDFCHLLLYYYPDMKSEPLQGKFKDFPWEYNEAHLSAWKKGLTGYPLVDAGMRQLWQTGWMHNRVRMIVGSFLVKHLLQPWQEGEVWFWDTLVDACPANNTAGWQWVAGCGADAAPYFRVFNPITQGDKFNAYTYVRKYVPEIAHLDDKYLFSPRESPIPPKNYPKPLVSHQDGRERALAAFEKIKQ